MARPQQLITRPEEEQEASRAPLLQELRRLNDLLQEQLTLQRRILAKVMLQPDTMTAAPAVAVVTEAPVMKQQEEATVVTPEIIRVVQPQLTTPELVESIRNIESFEKLMLQLSQRYLDPLPAMTFTLPQNGGFQAVPSGQMRIDFENGDAALPQSAGRVPLGNKLTLARRGQDYVRSGVIWVDSWADMEFEGSPGRIFLKPGEFFPFGGISFKSLTLSSPLPYSVFGIFSTSPVLGFAPSGPIGFLERYSASIDAAEMADFDENASLVPMSPFSFNMNENTVSLLSATLRASQIRTAHVTKHLWLVHNTGSSNSVFVNFQGRIVNSGRFVSDASTGSSVTITAGSNQVISSDLAYSLVRLRARAAVGSPTTIEVQYRGLSS